MPQPSIADHLESLVQFSTFVFNNNTVTALATTVADNDNDDAAAVVSFRIFFDVSVDIDIVVWLQRRLQHNCCLCLVWFTSFFVPSPFLFLWIMREEGTFSLCRFYYDSCCCLQQQLLLLLSTFAVDVCVSFFLPQTGNKYRGFLLLLFCSTQNCCSYTYTYIHTYIDNN